MVEGKFAIRVRWQTSLYFLIKLDIIWAIAYT